jgi:L-alanine-DL-glutamate epimerase-like enolase superfamily enzyme
MSTMHAINRRRFLGSLGAAPILANYHQLTAAEKGKVKISDIKVMAIQGPRTYNLVKVETDAGIYGIGEAYGSPGAGVKEQVMAMKPEMVGKDPLGIEKLTTIYSRTDGSAHSLMRALSGIEVALWDLAGKILGVPATTLLGGAFRDRVRVYDHSRPKDMLDTASCRDWAAEARANPAGFSAHKFGLQHTTPVEDPGRDLANRRMSTLELNQARQGFENCREAIGWSHDIMVHCHWEFDLRTSILIAEAVAPMKPLFFEDPLQVHYTDAWSRLTAMSPVAICTGENWMRRQEALPFVINHGCDILHPDLRNSGGFLETKRMADMADLYGLPMANHNTGGIVNTMATIQWAASIRDYLACETVMFKGDWLDDVILHDGPLVEDGFVKLPNKPGLGIELNPDVVKAHLAEGESWWG